MTCRQNKLLLLLLSINLITFSISSNVLEAVDDADLEKLIVNEKFVIALFIPSQSCSSCSEVEAMLSSIREELVDGLNADVVKLESSPLIESNFTSPAGKPLVVYFRLGIPMIYDGPWNDEVMLETFLQNTESRMNYLNDDSFEHLTQAASGATTGDWFVMFFRNDCEPCMKFKAKWEYIASQLFGRINLATVNIMEDGISTGSRFGVQDVPTFLFFRQGKYFHYDLPNHDSKAFQDFALGWYKNTPSKSVPAPKTPFDELVDRVVFTLKENPLILPVSGIAVLIIVIVIGLNAFKGRRKTEKPAKTKKNVKKSD